MGGLLSHSNICNCFLQGSKLPTTGSNPGTTVSRVIGFHRPPIIEALSVALLTINTMDWDNNVPESHVRDSITHCDLLELLPTNPGLGKGDRRTESSGHESNKLTK